MTKPKLSLWAQLPQWAWMQGLRNNIDFSRNPGSDTPGFQPEATRPTDCTDIKQAQTIISRIEYPQVTGMHKPVLDIDFPVQCVPSTTEGHFHLYMDKELTWQQYKTLLSALVDAGIIEEGYRNASNARGYTAVRVPWVRKEPIEAAPAPEPTEEPAAPQEATEEIVNLAEANAAINDQRHAYDAAVAASHATIAPNMEARLREMTEQAAVIERRIRTELRRPETSTLNNSPEEYERLRSRDAVMNNLAQAYAPRSILNEVLDQARRDRSLVEAEHAAREQEPHVRYDPIHLRYHVSSAGMPDITITAAAVSRGLINTSESLRSELERHGMEGDDFQPYFQQARREAGRRTVSGSTANGNWTMVENTPTAPPYFDGNPVASLPREYTPAWEHTPSPAPSVEDWTLQA